MNQKIRYYSGLQHDQRPIGLQMFIRYNPAQMYTLEAIYWWVKSGEPNDLESIFRLFKEVERLSD